MGLVINPSQDQLTTIYIIAGYFGAILVLWNVRYLKEVLMPFKIITVALHEFGHASAGCCTGAHIESIEVNPDEGGVTKLRGGNPYITLPAGYLGSAFWGALMVFAGFNILASKIVSGILIFALVLILYWAKNWLTRGVTLLFIALLGFLFWLEGGVGLRYVVLFMGVMSCMYSLWDIVEDLITRRVNESDASKFSKLCCGPPQLWGVIWFFISLSFLGVAIFAALVLFPDSNSSQISLPSN